VAGALVGLVRAGGSLVLLIKPQFEVGRREASRGRGVIRDPTLWSAAITDAGSAVEAAGATMMDVMASPLRGADGNVEFLALFHVVPPPADPLGERVGIASAVGAGVEG
jgi:23S rRNA (cytidine1920-2'-O)/16S rRNA (cytidine1409-2'-O)-methyltransferase